MSVRVVCLYAVSVFCMGVVCVRVRVLVYMFVELCVWVWTALRSFGTSRYVIDRFCVLSLWLEVSMRAIVAYWVSLA